MHTEHFIISMVNQKEQNESNIYFYMGKIEWNITLLKFERQKLTNWIQVVLHLQNDNYVIIMNL